MAASNCCSYSPILKKWFAEQLLTTAHELQVGARMQLTPNGPFLGLHSDAFGLAVSRAVCRCPTAANSRCATQISELGEIIPPNGVSRGFIFQLTRDGKTYQIAAVPQTYGVTGRQSVYSGQTLMIRAADGPQRASASSPEIR